MRFAWPARLESGELIHQFIDSGVNRYHGVNASFRLDLFEPPNRRKIGFEARRPIRKIWNSGARYTQRKAA